MKQLDVPRLRLRCDTLDAAVEAVFGADTLRKVHGDGLRADPFVDGQRTFRFDVDVSAVPAPLRVFFSGSKLGVTTRQTLTKRDDHWRVTNQLKMHFVGAELFRIRPCFDLTRNAADGTVSIGGAVRHDASLPRPFSGIAERFMAGHSERELRRFAEVLTASGVAVPDRDAPTGS